jgi:hypothetical protein
MKIKWLPTDVIHAASLIAAVFFASFHLSAVGSAIAADSNQICLINMCPDQLTGSLYKDERYFHNPRLSADQVVPINKNDQFCFNANQGQKYDLIMVWGAKQKNGQYEHLFDCTWITAGQTARLTPQASTKICAKDCNYIPPVTVCVPNWALCSEGARQPGPEIVPSVNGGGFIL